MRIFQVETKDVVLYTKPASRKSNFMTFLGQVRLTILYERSLFRRP